MGKRFLIAGIAAMFLFSGCSTQKTPVIPELRQSVCIPGGEIKSILLHLGHNMWCDWPTKQMGDSLSEAVKSLPEGKVPNLRLLCDDAVWKEVTDYAAEKGINLIVVDLGEGLEYPSHPELAIEGTWSVNKMQDEIRRLNSLGIEVVPKLNFSTTHNGWMKDYRHMVSSQPYYRMCEDVITDVYEIFGHPRFFHIGYDEEDIRLGHRFSYRIQRVGESWWTDFLHIVRTLENLGVRPWVWSDYGWDHPDYFERCPKSVIQQNWYYDEFCGGFDIEKNNTVDRRILEAYLSLYRNGYDQVPCASTYIGKTREKLGIDADYVMKGVVDFSKENISGQHLLGFMMASWCRTTPDRKEKIIRSIDIFTEAVK